MGSIYIGTNKLRKCFVGNSKVKAIYLGNTKVYNASSTIVIDGTQYEIEGNVETSNYKIRDDGFGLATIWFKSVGSHTFKLVEKDSNYKIRCCLVAGGSAGTGGNQGVYPPTVWAIGGNGGAGGEIVNASNLSPTIGSDYSLYVGNSASNSTGFGYTARTGYGASGGAHGAVETDVITHAKNGGAGSYAFGDSSVDGIRYGAGGGGGSGWVETHGTANPGSGGASGGGNGSGNGSVNGYNGIANTGGGGGGGGAHRSSTSGASNGGTGGSGIIIIQIYNP